MSDGAGTWSTRLIGAGCTAVIVVGAFAISGNESGGKPKSASGVAPVAHHVPGGPSNTPVPKPTPSPSGTASVLPSQAATSVAPPSPVPSHSGTATTPTPTASARPSVGASSSASPATSQHATTPIPAGVLGAFSYATTGYEQTSFPGTKRTYPSTTTITNKRAGCGVESTWQPVPQHVQSQELCALGGSAQRESIYLASYSTTLSFYGISSGEDFKCGTDAILYQPGVKVGHVWNYKCRSSDATATQAGHVLGYSAMTVGGASVRVLHVKVKTTLTGADEGKSTQDYWIETGKPVLVKESGTVDATQKSIEYEESYSLTLDSLTPRS